MNELTKSHPSLSDLSFYLKNAQHSDELDPVGIHVEECHECQQQLTELLCSNASFLDAIREDVSGEIESPSWLNDMSYAAPGPHAGFGSTSNFDKQTRYRLVEEVARGGMGIVYRALDQEFDREVAVKVVADESVDINRFEREARISGQLQHPGIVPIHDHGVLQNGEPFIAMKLVEGKTLREILDGGSMSVSRLIDIFSQVCQTVAYSHSQSVVHRDLKPANIMVGAYGEVQIMDWGLAKKIDVSVEANNRDNEFSSSPFSAEDTVAFSAHDTDGAEVNRLSNPDQTLCGTVIGTLAYMPIEQALSRPVGLQADVFALGGILCEILTGQPPFRRTDEERNASVASRFENENCQLSNAIDNLDSCSADATLVEIAKHCLAREASSRPANAAIVSTRLTEFTVSRDQRLQEVELERASSTARLQVETKRRKQVFRLAAVIATTLAVTTVATALYLNERNTRQAELFHAEKTAMEERSATESRIRSIMSDAQTQLQYASTAADSDRVSAWSNANVEIKRAFDNADSVDNRELLDDLKNLKGDIQQGLKLAQLTEAKNRNEKQIAQAIERAVERSTYPNDLMKVGVDPNVTRSLEDAFANYELEFESDITKAAERIRNSSIQETLVIGIRKWRSQHRNIHRGKSTCNLKWFEQLLNEVDPDPFRVQVRKLASKQDASKVADIINDPRALESIVTVHTVFDYLNSTRQKRPTLGFMKRAHVKYPDDLFVNDALRSFYKRFYSHKPELAMRHTLACLAIQPDNPGLLINLSVLYISLGDNDSAIEVCDRMIELVPNYPQSYNNAAIALSNKNELNKAIEYYQKAVKVAPDFHTTYGNLAVALGQLDRNQEAIEAMKKAIKLNSKHAKHHVVFGKLLLAVDEKEEAEKAVRRGLELQPRNLGGLQNIIKLLRDRGDFDEAIEFHKQQIKYHKHKTDTWANYAETLFAAERYEEAEDLIDGPFNRHFQPLYADVLARAQWAQGKQEEAIETLKLQIQNRPNSKEARELLKKYQDD